MIIGLSGYARSGKDTLGSILVEEHGFTQIAYADALKRLLHQLNPIVSIDAASRSEAPRILLDDLLHSPYSDSSLSGEPDWEYAKRLSPDVRPLLQRLGEGARTLIGPDVWVSALTNSLHPHVNYVITDVRYPNETVICDEVWRINRQGNRPANAHISETALDNFACTHRIAVPESSNYRQLLQYVTAELLA